MISRSINNLPDASSEAIVVRRIENRHTILLGGRHVEGGVLHAQRGEDAVLQKDVEGIAGDDLHQATEHIHRVAVLPAAMSKVAHARSAMYFDPNLDSIILRSPVQLILRSKG